MMSRLPARHQQPSAPSRAKMRARVLTWVRDNPGQDADIVCTATCITRETLRRLCELGWLVGLAGVRVTTQGMDWLRRGGL